MPTSIASAITAPLGRPSGWPNCPSAPSWRSKRGPSSRRPTSPRICRIAVMGPALIVFALLIALPVGTLIGGAVLAVILGFLVKTEVDQEHEGSELLELNI